jgi:hypothetical protein
VNLVGINSQRIFSDVQQIKDPNLYYIPSIHHNYDSVDVCGTAFQMTVSLTHGLKHLPLVDLRKTFDLKNRQLHVYFVVPRDIYQDFKKQSYLTTTKETYKRTVKNIKQFVVCMNVVKF